MTQALLHLLVPDGAVLAGRVLDGHHGNDLPVGGGLHPCEGDVDAIVGPLGQPGAVASPGGVVGPVLLDRSQVFTLERVHDAAQDDLVPLADVHPEHGVLVGQLRQQLEVSRQLPGWGTGHVEALAIMPWAVLAPSASMSSLRPVTPEVAYAGCGSAGPGPLSGHRSGQLCRGHRTRAVREREPARRCVGQDSGRHGRNRAGPGPQVDAGARHLAVGDAHLVRS